MKIVTLDEIRHLYNESLALEKLRQGFIAFSANRVQTPSIQQFVFKEVEGDCCIKSAWVEGTDRFCVKVSSGFYQNERQGLPSNDGLTLLFSALTGRPEVLLNDHGWLTGMRTALAGRIVAELMAPEKIERIAILGTGLQAELQLRQLLDLTSCNNVIVWGRSQHALERYAERLSDLNLNIQLTRDEERAARHSSIIVTTTAAANFLVKNEWIGEGTHITAVGADAPGKNELEPSLVARADLILVDSVTQCSSYGELSQLTDADRAEKNIIEIGQLLSQPGRYSRHPQDITIADLTGLGVQDAQIAASIPGI